MARKWNFLGELMENGFRVLTKAKATLNELEPEQPASVDINTVGGEAQFIFNLPKNGIGPTGPQGLQGEPGSARSNWTHWTAGYPRSSGINWTSGH